MKLILSIVAIAFSIYSVGATTVATTQQSNGKNLKKTLKSIIAAERLKLKNAAFCECMHNSFPDSVFQNEGSQAGYVKFGTYSFKAYETVMKFAKEQARKNYSSKNNRNLGMMKCLDFYNSKELDSLVRKLDSELHIRK
jgi:hypothetical protein